MTISTGLSPATSAGIVAARLIVELVEEGGDLSPKFDANGLLPAITTDITTGGLLMVGDMNAEALRKILEGDVLNPTLR